MSSKVDFDLDAWGSLDWDAELEKANSDDQPDSGAYSLVNSTFCPEFEANLRGEADMHVETRNQENRALSSSTLDMRLINPKLQKYPNKREPIFHPGWAPVLSPPLVTSTHSTAPEVMKWVRSPGISASLEYYRHQPEKRRVPVSNAQALVDFDVDLSAYKFPHGASGRWNPLPSPFPRRRWWQPKKARRSKAETLEYSASDIRAIERNVMMQLSGPKVSPETGDESGSGPDSESNPIDGRDSGYDGDLFSNESTDDARLQDSGVDFGTRCEEAKKAECLEDSGRIL